jgi:hypothetical protein
VVLKIKFPDKEPKKMNWKIKTLLIGASVGAATGLLAAIIIMQRAEQNETRPQITAGDGVKVGLGVLGVLRLLSDMGSHR